MLITPILGDGHASLPGLPMSGLHRATYRTLDLWSPGSAFLSLRHSSTNQIILPPVQNTSSLSPFLPILVSIVLAKFMNVRRRATYVRASCCCWTVLFHPLLPAAGLFHPHMMRYYTEYIMLYPLFFTSWLNSWVAAAANTFLPGSGGMYDVAPFEDFGGGRRKRITRSPLTRRYNSYYLGGSPRK